jgi:hypothetical protein
LLIISIATKIVRSSVLALFLLHYSDDSEACPGARPWPAAGQARQPLAPQAPRGAAGQGFFKAKPLWAKQLKRLKKTFVRKSCSLFFAKRFVIFLRVGLNEL